MTDLTGNLDEITGLGIQPDGKIVAAGFANAGGGATDFAVVRYHPNGTVDKSFGNNGVVQTDFAGGVDGASAMALLPSGKIVVAGTTYNSQGIGDIALVRYNPDGRLDPDFGFGGKVRTDFGANENAADLALTSGNKLVVAGATGQPGAYDMAVARYNANGSLDTTFSGDGKFRTDFAGYGTTDGASGVAVQEDGKIVVVGDTSRFPTGDGGFDFAVLRLNPGGRIDSNFGNGGKVLIDFGGLAASGETNDNSADVVIQPTGEIVVSGDAEIEPNRLHDTAVARLLGSSLSASAAPVEAAMPDLR